jgi:hypothetical protein
MYKILCSCCLMFSMRLMVILLLLLCVGCSSTLTYKVREEKRQHEIRNLTPMEAVAKIASRAGAKNVHLYLKDGRLIRGKFQGISADSIWITDVGMLPVSQLRRIEVEGIYVQGSRLMGGVASGAAALVLGIFTCGPFGCNDKRKATIVETSMLGIWGSGFYFGNRHKMREVYIFD